MKATVYRLGWSGVQEVEIDVKDLPLEVLEVDNWMSPQIGELCLNSNNELDVVKDIRFKPSDGTFKARNIYSFEHNDETCSDNMVTRIEVKAGHTFIFNGKVFVHQEALDGGYIDKIARQNPITEYEYEQYQ